ncbi:carbon-nitrogen hydrolase family protein [Ruegeria atlantica]|uniref:(R)-stereoselective amidase n=1 Tax=Ruegeria atlantica TaxID=81569 RepID=A0A0N7LN64_9RHOB|nr:carbon-nitrogen hydrolase family protein [Ruegeria atlantica]CUH41548.1 (R)-stereoselective amidase [Ruegeria atlantica]
MREPFRIAIGQSPAELATPQARIAWLRDALPEVQARQSDLLLLPELFATGYNIGAKIDVRAEDADGPTATVIAALAKQHDLAIHYGFAERDGARIFNAAQCFGPDGIQLGGHRKMAIPPGFEADHFTRGKGCRLFTYRGLRIATLICYDAEFPEAARHVATMGAELILIPTALGYQWEWVAQSMIPTRAYENGLFVAYANSAGVENGMRFLGQSFVAAPDGQEIVRASGLPGIVYGTIRPHLVAKAQRRLPYLEDAKKLKGDLE